MHTEFRRAALPDEIGELLAFDRKTFPASDRFPTHLWMHLESYWLLVDGVKAGCCAFDPHVDFQEDRSAGESNPRARGCLYIASTAILPRYQGHGFGRLMKAWQIAYAQRNKFHRIVTNTRRRNRAMIRLNEAFGFRVVRVTPRYYSDPTDATVVMELRIGHKK